MYKKILEEHWNHLKNHLKEIWQDLPEMDEKKLTSGLEDAINYLQERYGETREMIEGSLYKFLENKKK